MSERTISALFVDADGPYAGIAGVDVWDAARDARLYAGPHAVIAHPPCGRWSRLAGLAEWKHGLRRGDDGGCFSAALNAVRTWGGVLEHPAFTRAWSRYSLPVPIEGVWQRGICGGWVAHVEQRNYGHAARKATWLYAFGAELPRLDLTTTKHGVLAQSSWGQGREPDTDDRHQLSKRERRATPPAFRDVLIAMAQSVRTPG